MEGTREARAGRQPFMLIREPLTPTDRVARAKRVRFPMSEANQDLFGGVGASPTAGRVAAPVQPCERSEPLFSFPYVFGVKGYGAKTLNLQRGRETFGLGNPLGRNFRPQKPAFRPQKPVLCKLRAPEAQNAKTLGLRSPLGRGLRPQKPTGP